MKAISWNDGWTVKHLDETGEGTPVRIPPAGMSVMITYMKKISYRVMNTEAKK